VITDSPLALLIEEKGAWSFVALVDGICQEILSGLNLSYPAERRESPSILSCSAIPAGVPGDDIRINGFIAR
jgi:hypothetical protein